MPSSRPKPDCFMPPNGVWTRTELFELTDSTPAAMPRATRSARAPSRVQIEPGEPVRCVVRDPDRVGLVGEGDHGRDRAEDLLARDTVVVRCLDERAGEPESRPGRNIAPEERLALDERGHRRAVLGGDQRPHLGRVVGRIANLDAAGRIDEQLDEAVVGRALDEDARAGTAVLARVVEHRVRRRCGRLLEIGVGEDHVRGLAAELEGHALDRRRRALHHALADLGRAGEADLGDVRVLDETLADDRARPTTTLSTPSGMPASSASSPSRSVVSGVSSAGLITIVFPVASAGPIFQLAMLSGKFQGVIRPTTPSGSRKVTSMPPATGIVSP